MVQLTELNRISIAEICVYTPFFLIAIFLAFRHGLRRNAGWLYLILFTLARLLGAAMQLATINDPTNFSLYIGSMTIESVGLSPLILIMIALVGRVLQSIRLSRKTLLRPHMLRIVQLVVLVGMILGIVGGSDLGRVIQSSPAVATEGYDTPVMSKAGIGCMLAGYGFLAICTGLVAVHVSSAEPGEKRLLLAVALALPFVLVRLIYSALVIFDSRNPNYRQFGGNSSRSYMIGMSVVMEMVAVAIFEVAGCMARPVSRFTSPTEKQNNLESGEESSQR